MKDLFGKSGVAGIVSSEKSVAIKLHMGELGNVTYIRPLFVRRVVDLVKRAGGKPFITDTTALYPGARGTPERYLGTAAANGFTETGIGAPVAIADDGEAVTVAVERLVDDCEIREVKVAPRIYHADRLLVLSHTKGHLQAGFGVAIKNMAMGCVTKEGKAAQHRATIPEFDASKCDACSQCVEACPRGSLTLVEGTIVRDMNKCMGCSSCLFLCPSKAFHFAPGFSQRLQVNLAHTVYGVLKNFKGKAGFLNFVQDVTPECDCVAPAGRPLVQDVGILASLDPVAIDKASIDLIDKAPAVGNAASLKRPDLLGKMHNTDSLVQLRTAEKLGLGSLDYKLVTI
jgi:uncharacterized Fe-S center protein